MSFIYEQLAVIVMGGVFFIATRCKIHPTWWQEIVGMMIGLGIVFLLQKYFGWYSNITVMKMCKFLLLGYLPGRLIFRGKRKKDE